MYYGTVQTLQTVLRPPAAKRRLTFFNNRTYSLFAPVFRISSQPESSRCALGYKPHDGTLRRNERPLGYLSPRAAPLPLHYLEPAVLDRPYRTVAVLYRALFISRDSTRSCSRSPSRSPSPLGPSPLLHGSCTARAWRRALLAARPRATWRPPRGGLRVGVRG